MGPSAGAPAKQPSEHRPISQPDSVGSRQAGGQSTADSGTAALPSVAADLASDRTALLSRLHATQGHQAFLGLQRTAGNAAVARWIDRTRGVPAPVVQRTPDPSPGVTEVRRLIGRNPALRGVVAGALRAAQPGRAASLPQWITVRFPQPIDDAIALHPSEIDALLCEVDPMACRSSASAGPTASSRPAAGPSTPGTGRAATPAIAIAPYRNPAEWLAALIDAASSDAQLVALAAALQQAGSTERAPASFRVDVEIPDRGRLVGLPVAEIVRLERLIDGQRQALRVPAAQRAASQREFAQAQAASAVRNFLHDLDVLPSTGTVSLYLLRTPDGGTQTFTLEQVQAMRSRVATQFPARIEEVRNRLAGALTGVVALRQALDELRNPTRRPSAGAAEIEGERLAGARGGQLRNRWQRPGTRADRDAPPAIRVRQLRNLIDSVSHYLTTDAPVAEARAAALPIPPAAPAVGRTHLAEAHNRLVEAARLTAQLEREINEARAQSVEIAESMVWLLRFQRGLLVLVTTVAAGPVAGTALQTTLSTIEAGTEVAMGLRQDMPVGELAIEAATSLATSSIGNRLAQPIARVLSRRIAAEMAEWGVSHRVQQTVLRQAVPQVVDGVADRLAGVAGAWASGRLRGASDAEIDRAIQEQLDLRSIVTEVLAQQIGTRLRNRPGAAGATASGPAGRPAGGPRTGSPPDTTQSGPRQRSRPAGPDEQAQPTEPDRASRPQRGDDAVADDEPTRPDLTLPTRIAETEVETFTHQQFLEFFVRLVRRPGPPREQLVVFRTREEFEATWRSRYPTRPMPDGWHGYNSGQPGRIYLPPRSRPLAMLHEALHWASARSRSLEELGQFWDEGVTEWLARRLLGARGSRLAYDANVRFVDELVAEIGDGPILHGYLDRDWSSLRAAIARRVGNETQGASVFDLMRRVGRHQGSSPDLQAARNLLRIGQGTDTAPTGIRRPRPGPPDPAPATSAPPEPGPGPHERPTLPPPPGTPYPPRDYTNPTQ